jgi:hypothetical protein
VNTKEFARMCGLKDFDVNALKGLGLLTPEIIHDPSSKDSFDYKEGQLWKAKEAKRIREKFKKKYPNEKIEWEELIKHVPKNRTLSIF